MLLVWNLFSLLCRMACTVHVSLPYNRHELCVSKLGANSVTDELHHFGLSYQALFEKSMKGDVRLCVAVIPATESR